MSTVRVEDSSLVFAFPEVHADARFSLNFQRTLRIPDDDKVHSLPPGLGSFPLRNVDDHARAIPAKWAERGGIMLPMYQSEALWLSFGWDSYPFAVKVATGKVCCLTGEIWKDGLTRDPQNYLVVPGQPWLDGYNVGGDQIRQFVAAPLEHEASVEKQVTGEATEGGMQLEVRPMTAVAWEKHKAKLEVDRGRGGDLLLESGMALAGAASPEMGFAAGGRMRQEIYEDPYGADEWCSESATCNVWVCNSLAWRAITHEVPTTSPPEPADYKRAGLPWFDYFGDGRLIKGSAALAALKSYKAGNESVNFSPEKIVEIRRQRGLGTHDIRVRGNN